MEYLGYLHLGFLQFYRLHQTTLLHLHLILNLFCYRIYFPLFNQNHPYHFCLKLINYMQFSLKIFHYFKNHFSPTILHLLNLHLFHQLKILVNFHYLYFLHPNHHLIPLHFLIHYYQLFLHLHLPPNYHLVPHPEPHLHDFLILLRWPLLLLPPHWANCQLYLLLHSHYFHFHHHLLFNLLHPHLDHHFFQFLHFLVLIHLLNFLIHYPHYFLLICPLDYHLHCYQYFHLIIPINHLQLLFIQNFSFHHQGFLLLFDLRHHFLHFINLVLLFRLHHLFLLLAIDLGSPIHYCYLRFLLRYFLLINFVHLFEPHHRLLLQKLFQIYRKYLNFINFNQKFVIYFHFKCKAKHIIQFSSKVKMGSPQFFSFILQKAYKHFSKFHLLLKQPHLL